MLSYSVREHNNYFNSQSVINNFGFLLQTNNKYDSVI